MIYKYSQSQFYFLNSELWGSIDIQGTENYDKSRYQMFICKRRMIRGKQLVFCVLLEQSSCELNIKKLDKLFYCRMALFKKWKWFILFKICLYFLQNKMILGQCIEMIRDLSLFTAIHNWQAHWEKRKLLLCCFCAKTHTTKFPNHIWIAMLLIH
jgi:hypothetical protein